MNLRKHKALYKQFLHVRKNIQNKSKIFKFKKEKWKRFQLHSQRQLKFFKRFRIKDQYQQVVQRFSSQNNSFGKKFRNNLLERKTFRLFYGNLKHSSMRRLVQKIYSSKEAQMQFLKSLESRLDVILHRSSFASSIKAARQMILHNHVYVNNTAISSQQYYLQPGDIVTISKSVKIRKFIARNLDMSNFWPVPQQHVIINYRTLQIFFCSQEKDCFVPFFNYYLNTGSVMNNLKKK